MPEISPELKAKLATDRRWAQIMHGVSPHMYQARADLHTGYQHMALPPALLELMWVAVNAQASHMYMSGAEIHMVRALELGATPRDLGEALALAASPAYRSLREGLAALEAVYGLTDPSPPSEEALQVRQAYEEQVGDWPDWLDHFVRVMPHLVAPLLQYVSLRGDEERLDERWRALILLAVAISPTNMDLGGAREALERCRQLQIPVDQVHETIYAGSLIATHSCSAGFFHLEEALDPTKDRQSLGSPRS